MSWTPAFVFQEVITFTKLNQMESDDKTWQGNVDANNFQLINVNRVAVKDAGADSPASGGFAIFDRGTTWKSRVGAIRSNIPRCDIAVNGVHDGTNWLRDDITLPLLLLSLQGGQMVAAYAAAGANPVTSLPQSFSFDLTAGNLNMIGAINTLGRNYVGAPATAPTDGNIATSQISLWLDEAGNKLTFRVRYSNGVTLKTGTVTLV